MGDVEQTWFCEEGGNIWSKAGGNQHRMNRLAEITSISWSGWQVWWTRRSRTWWSPRRTLCRRRQGPWWAHGWSAASVAGAAWRRPRPGWRTGSQQLGEGPVGLDWIGFTIGYWCCHRSKDCPMTHFTKTAMILCKHSIISDQMVSPITYLKLEIYKWQNYFGNRRCGLFYLMSNQIPFFCQLSFQTIFLHFLQIIVQGFFFAKSLWVQFLQILKIVVTDNFLRRVLPNHFF